MAGQSLRSPRVELELRTVGSSPLCNSAYHQGIEFKSNRTLGTFVLSCPYSLATGKHYGKLAMRIDGVIRSHECSPIVVPP